MGRKLLVVEEDSEDAELLRHGLADSCPDCRITIVRSAQAAMELLTRGDEQPQLAVISLDLPGTASLDLLAWIRAREPLRTLPAIVLTRTLETGLIEAAYGCGADSCLLKTGDRGLLARLDSLWRHWNDGGSRLTNQSLE